MRDSSSGEGAGGRAAMSACAAEAASVSACLIISAASAWVMAPFLTSRLMRLTVMLVEGAAGGAGPGRRYVASGASTVGPGWSLGLSCPGPALREANRVAMK